MPRVSGTGRFFGQDLGEPGLRPTRPEDGPFDIVYESGGKGRAFNGDWKAQGLSKDDYRRAFAATDETYAHALDTLLRSLAESEGASGAGAQPSLTVPRVRWYPPAGHRRRGGG